MQRLGVRAPVCPLCARAGVDDAVCGACQRRPPHFDAFWASLQYVAPLPALVHSFKFEKHIALARPLAQLMLANPPPWLPEVRSELDAIVAMPLSEARLLQRGFNQSRELAVILENSLGIKVLPSHLIKRKATPPQSTLSREDRIRNVRGVFSPQFEAANRKILLVDDVLTTGATLSELALSLKKSGAAAVFAWTLTRA